MQENDNDNNLVEIVRTAYIAKLERSVDELHVRLKDIRQELHDAFDHILHLEKGFALHCTPIKDPDQRKELLMAMESIATAIDLTSGKR